jgi:rare lipoprotein A
MHQDGRTMSADEFDAWMRARQIRVATGKPTPVAASAARAPAPAAPVAAAGAPVAIAAQATPTAEGITLQVASFSNQRNAEQALSLLRGAAIAQAQLQDADINGRKVWRLRIGPVSEAATPELAARIVGLGFGQPQRIRN